MPEIERDLYAEKAKLERSETAFRRDGGKVQSIVRQMFGEFDVARAEANQTAIDAVFEGHEGVVENWKKAEKAIAVRRYDENVRIGGEITELLNSHIANLSS